MEEVDACWDEPSVCDVRSRELYGDIYDYPKAIDNRTVTTIYNQWLLDITRMACGSYGVIHTINVANYYTGWWEHDPKEQWIRFVERYKTEEYDPVSQGSSLQDQLDFAKKLWFIDWYYRISRGDNIVLEIKSAIARGEYIYTGSKQIDWKATRASDDKVAVVGNGSAHIVEIDWYNNTYLFCRNSYGDKSYDWWYFYLKREDISCLFTIYAVKDHAWPERKDRIRDIVSEKKKTMRYGLKKVNGRNKIWQRPK